MGKFELLGQEDRLLKQRLEPTFLEKEQQEVILL
jgi:hypothetical protein